MAKKKPVITNAMRGLTAAKIPFEAIEYEVDEVGDNFGVQIAELTGIPCEKSFKTLVAKGNEIMVVCVPVDAEVDLKKLAVASGNKKVELIAVKDLLALTGYVRGGVSPIGMKKKYATYIHETCLSFDKMAVSGGTCGVTLLLSQKDLINVTNAKTCDIIKE
jgi:Cys-tRNA(Pro)/Cys-tRNA(Cys) deacylase